MPDDDPPLSSTVTETTTIDTGADKQTTADTLKVFEDFWKEEDAKTDGAPPEAPGEDGAAQETFQSTQRHHDTAPKDSIGESPDPLSEKRKDYSDDEIERLALTKSDRPEAIEGFKQLKDGWKAERARAKAESERAAKLERELAEARQNAWTPESKADYEHAAAVRRKFNFVEDPEFQARFVKPITTSYHQVLNEAVDALPDRAAAQAWAKYIAENYAPDTLDKNWWNHSVIDKIPDEMDRAAVRQSVTNLLKMQKERDQEIQHRSSDKSAYDNWVKEREESKAQFTQKEVMAEIGIQEQKLKDILRKDPAEARTKEEREAIEKHNEEFDRYNGHFQEVMKDLSFNGPRAMVRAAVLATKAEWIEDKYKKAEAELKTTRTERDQYKKELEKISGARRRISHTTGTPPASSSSAKNGQGLSLSKDGLDVNKSFQSFDWGDK